MPEIGISMPFELLEVHYILHPGRSFMALLLIGQRRIEPIVGCNIPGTPFCVYSRWASSIFGFKLYIDEWLNLHLPTMALFPSKKSTREPTAQFLTGFMLVVRYSV